MMHHALPGSNQGLPDVQLPPCKHSQTDIKLLLKPVQIVIVLLLRNTDLTRHANTFAAIQYDTVMVGAVRQTD